MAHRSLVMPFTERAGASPGVLARLLARADALAASPWLLWLPLLALLTIPVPFRGIPMPERGVPIFYLLMAGGLVVVLRIARASWPFALLMFWGLVHLYFSSLSPGGFSMRVLQVDLLLAMAGLLFAAAAEMPSRARRQAAWVLLVSGMFQGLLGLLNTMGVIPSPIIFTKPLFWFGVDYDYIRLLFGEPRAVAFPGYEGLALGWLTHPNYWGSYMALIVPVAAGLLGPIPGLVAFAVTLLSRSIGPAVSAAAGLIFMAWPAMSRRVRLLALGASVLVVFAVGMTHVLPRVEGGKPVTLEAVTSGRSVVWTEAWPHIADRWLLGNGLGSWRLWAVEYNKVTKTNTATLQAHNEAVQLWFEMGLIGVLLVLAWVWQTSRNATTVCRRWPEERLWVGLVIVAVVNSFGSPTFHLPAQAAIALFALAQLQGMTASANNTRRS